jgi:hypothetical protein
VNGHLPPVPSVGFETGRQVSPTGSLHRGATPTGGMQMGGMQMGDMQMGDMQTGDMQTGGTPQDLPAKRPPRASSKYA